MALNLVRNSRVFFTTNVNSAGVIQATGFSTANTQEIQVLEGFTFSQNTNATQITISEAGAAPVRGQRSFNTSLAPVDFSFSTYIRPNNATTSITAEEGVLWNALMGINAISTANTITVGGTVSTAAYAFGTPTAGNGTITITGTGMTYAGVSVGDWIVIGGLTGTTDLTIVNNAALVTGLSATSITLDLATPKAAGAAITGITIGALKFYRSAWAPVATNYSVVTTGGSNVNQLQKFGLFFSVDNVVYQVDNCALNQAVIDFGLGNIATIAWTGQATALTSSTVTLATILAGYTPKVTTAPFITNKLSTVTMSLVNALGGTATAGFTYAIALTGGSLTINNNISYVTPANLGIVNIPAVYYTGTRSISGSMTAYLKTGTGVNGTGQLLADMLSNISTAVEPMAAISLAIGGSTNATKIVLDMPAVTFTIPTVDAGQPVVSTTINFTAEGYVPSATAGGNAFALDEVSDLTVRYYSA